MAFHWLNNHVNVVGHDAPGMKSVALIVEVQQRAGNHLCDTIIPQDAIAVALIQQTLKRL